VEEIVDRVVEPGTNAIVLPSWTVQVVTLVPGGARPSYAHGYYARDNAFYVAWDEISRDRDRFRAWMDAHVYAGQPADGAARAVADEPGTAGIRADPAAAGRIRR
jgi:glutaconate CoA-transferase subunit A